MKEVGSTRELLKYNFGMCATHFKVVLHQQLHTHTKKKSDKHIVLQEENF